MVNSSLEEDIKLAISKVNLTLGIYEKDYISQQRTPTTDREVCRSFEQFIECKWNYECSKIPSLKKLVDETQGHLFFCTKLEEADVVKRKFKKAYIKLLTPTMVEDISDELHADLDELTAKLGGYTEFTFNSVKKKIKLTFN